MNFQVKYLQKKKFSVILLLYIMLIGCFSFTLVLSSYTNSVTINSTGQISILNINATSGSAIDIQAAVDQVVAAGGIGNVYIPEGTFNFTEVGEPWMTVDIPAGVNLFGAHTERDANGQVIEWKTNLVMPYDVPGAWGSAPWWFRIIGNGDPSKPSRFSNVKLVGYRSIDPNSITIHLGIDVQNVVDFRIDHNYFEHITGTGINIFGMNTRGVIDHSFFVNPVGHVESGYMDCSVGYGIMSYREYGDVWEPNVSLVLGQYTNYSIYIEDCYFEKWRHAVASNTGAHYVFRYNTIKDDFGFGSLDAHGWGVWDGQAVTQVGTRAVEIYENQIMDAIMSPWATFIRGGSGVAFNNTVGGGTYTSFMYFSNEAQPEVSKCWIHDWWVWNNTLLSGSTEIIVYDPLGNINEGIDYFRYEPHTFVYQPYFYPHPLTLSGAP